MFIELSKSLMRGRTILRAMMNQGLSRHSIGGTVVDVGGGRQPDYFNYLRVAPGTKIIPVDGSIDGIDFEKDKLPFRDGEADHVLCCNVLEHVYEYGRLIGEMRRILKPGGMLIGFVPFLINYHPDPHDYFRYTKEALARMLGAFKEVEIREVGIGPLTVGLNNIILHVPSILKPIPFFFCYFADKLWLRLRPDITSRYPLGYVFSGRK